MPIFHDKWWWCTELPPIFLRTVTQNWKESSSRRYVRSFWWTILQVLHIMSKLMAKQKGTAWNWLHACLIKLLETNDTGMYSYNQSCMQSSDQLHNTTRMFPFRLVLSSQYLHLAHYSHQRPCPLNASPKHRQKSSATALYHSNSKCAQHRQKNESHSTTT